MMNVFYHDRITLGPSEIEEALKRLSYGDAAGAVRLLAEIRRLVDTVFDLSKHTSHFWMDDAGPDWPSTPGPINPRTGQSYSHVDQ